MKRFLLFGLLPTLLVLLGVTALYTVDEAEYAYVTRFGELRVIHDGATQAGLHVKWPWPIESVERLDRRLQVVALPAIEARTRDATDQTAGNTITAEVFLCWRIPDAEAARQFIRTCQTLERAQRLLEPVVISRLNGVISNMPLENLIRVDTLGGIDQRMERIRQQLLGQTGIGEEQLAPQDRFQAAARKRYGIEIIDIRLRRFNYPEAVRATIAERIRSERQLKVADYESQGRLKAAEIQATAEKSARITEALARATRQRLEGEAAVKADAIRNAAHAQDPEFYAFLQKLAAYRNILTESRDVLLLSTRHELFDMLLNPPKPDGGTRAMGVRQARMPASVRPGPGEGGQ